MPLKILENGLETKFPLKLLRRYGVIDRFQQKVTFIQMRPHLHAVWISLHDSVWDAIVEIIMRNGVVQVNVAADDVHVLIRFGKNHSARVNDSGFIGGNRRHDIIVVQPRINLKRKPSIIR